MCDNAEAKSTSTPNSSAPRLGTEGWLKLATVFLAFLYVCGYSGVTSFTDSFGVHPGDFGLTEKDYFIYGLIYMLPDSSFGRLETLPWVIWTVFILLFPLLFVYRHTHNESRRAWLDAMARSILL